MGNQPSTAQERPGLRFLRQSNALGLSKAELDKRCRSSGLYPSCHWEDKAIRRLIGDGKLARRLKGSEVRISDTDQECPICFLHYTEINTTKCCKAVICTECYLQVRPQREKQGLCPFCSDKLQVKVAVQLNPEEIAERERAEQRVEEALQRKREDAANKEDGQESNGFGSSLDEQNQLLIRKRSESLASSEDCSAEESSKNLLSAVAITPDERRELEARMSAQNEHPLAQRLQEEESERRMQNEMEYYRNQITNQQLREQSQRQGNRSGRDWNRIVDAFESGGNGQVQSLDDLVVLEAAIMLSMQQEGEEGVHGGNFDAAQHASRGFPLARARVDRNAGTLNSIARNLQAGRSQGGGSSIAQESASMMMRGMSEEQQLRMAIAASLAEGGGDAAAAAVGGEGDEQREES